MRAYLSKIKKGNIVFVTESNFSKGLGHYSRSTSFADYLKKNYNIFFYKNKNIKNIKIRYKTIEQEKQFQKIYIKNLQNIIIYDLKNIEDYRNLINSNYLKNYKKIFVHHKIPNFTYDLLIIPYIIGRSFNSNKIFSGHKFVILKKNFFQIYKPNKKFTVCISMGGSDIKEFTYKIINLLSKIKFNIKIEINVIIGNYFKKNHKKKVIQICKKNRFKYYLDPKNYVSIMKKSSFLVTNSGNSKFEAAALGIPFIILSNDKSSLKYCKEFSKILKSYHDKNYGIPSKSFLEKKIKYVMKHQKKAINFFKFNKKIINKSNVYQMNKIIEKI